MRKIGIDGHVLGDRSGGNETYYMNLIKNLSCNCDDIGFNIYCNKKYEIEVNQNINMKVKKFQTSNTLTRNLIECPYLEKKDKLDVMHFQYFLPPVNFCKTVVSIHDISFEHFDNIFEKKMLRIQKKLIPYAAKNADKILTVSEFSKKDIVEKYNIDEKKIVVTHLAASKEFRVLNNNEYIEKKEYLSKKFQITDKYILSVGNLQPRKNIKRLISVFIKLKKTNVDFVYKLVLVGKKAWMYDEIFETVRKNKLESDVILTDYVTNEELVYLYNCCELFVYPSFFEGFGLPPLEAMACGAAVVTSNVTSIPEVVGKDAPMFNPFDEDDMYKKIKDILDTDEYRLKLKEYGVSRSKQFSWSKMAKETLEVYKSLL